MKFFSVLILGSLLASCSSNPTQNESDSALNADKNVREIASERYDVSSYCKDRLSDLREAKRMAQQESQLQNFDRSTKILEQGLREAASKISPRFKNALTSKAIMRGVELIDELKDVKNDVRKLRTLNFFLGSYYNFIESVAGKVDIPYFMEGGFTKKLFSNTEFEGLFINFATEQVEMVITNMTSNGYGYNSDVIYPVGSPRMLLIALKQTTSYMANDLSESLFAEHYACTISKLDSVSSNLANYLEGDDSKYDDDYTAVQESVGKIKQVMNDKRRCR